MLGWTTEAYVELFCRGRTSPSDIAAAVSKYPEVTGAATITGEADALLHIRAADVRHFEEVVEHISAEPFVVRTKSVIVLSRLVSRAGFGPVGSQPPHQGETRFTADRCHGGAQRFGDLYGEHSHATGCAVDEHLLAWPDPRDVA